tara:strand:+ start:1959 stop:2351 length:393 start_codon:yes stop_codon:yes gene_type:complete
MPTFQTFKDLSVTFKKHPVTDDVITVKDKAAITQSIKNLLLTNKGERLFQPQLGSNLQKSLFEPLDYGTAGMIKSQVKETIKRWEPRVIVEDVLCEPDFNTNGYEVEIFYRIIGREDRQQQAGFFLERTR